MPSLELLGSALGVGLAAGIRLYATVLLLGLAIRFNLFQLSPEFAALHVLGSLPVLILAGVGTLAEFFADKVAWVDSAWDAVHTFIRPAGAAVIGGLAIGHADPLLATCVALLCGGVALTGHAAKASTRLAANHVPEPFSNVVLSLIEDAVVPVGLWISLAHPLIALGLVAAFVAVFLWLAPRVYRSCRLEIRAVRGLLSSWFGAPLQAIDLQPQPNTGAPVLRMLDLLRPRLQPVPKDYVRFILADMPGAWPTACVECALDQRPHQFNRRRG